jgi:hypothetical protein
MSAADEHDLFRRDVTRALPRARILKDTDDWPIVPGRNGRLEWRGPEPDGTHRVYVHCRPTRVAAVPGVQRWQIADNEATFWLRADDTTALKAVAKLLRLRYRTARVCALAPVTTARRSRAACQRTSETIRSRVSSVSTHSLGSRRVTRLSPH